MKILRVFEIEELRRAHIVAMYARKHINFDRALSQCSYIDNASCLQPKVSSNISVILLSLKGV